VVDVHCHLFNASDLPVRGFAQRVVLGDPEDQVVLGPDPSTSRAALPHLAGLLVELLSGPAPTARTELAAIDGDSRRVLRAGPPGPDSRIDIERVRQALQSVLAPSPEQRAALRPVDGQVPSEEGRAGLAHAIEAEVGAALDPGVMRRTDDRYEAMARGLLSGRGTISRYVQWAQWLTRPRREIVERAVDLYGGGHGLILFTPALIDFSQWLEDEPRSEIEDQIRVMERIQRLPLGTAVHCFAPYDPWRQITDEDDRRRPSAFDLVTWAVQDMGFVGVKLYPPMGFLPAGNAEVSQRYPARAEAVPDFPRKLDAALDKLYAWAAAEGVAVMAHASNSNGAADEYSERANPKGWGPVLERYPTLRLNLAHFGGFEGRIPDAGLDGTWEAAVGRLIAEDRSVYADVSYYSEVLRAPADGPEPRQLAKLMRQFLRAYDPNLIHLMYGSDWIMVGLEQDHEAYLGRVSQFFRQVADNEEQIGRVLAGNAARFLGLGPNDAARRRLQAYYERHQLNPGWMRQFDEIPTA
jgi:predicted TIM-barrel fold metal-dependent hydrolase